MHYWLYFAWAGVSAYALLILYFVTSIILALFNPRHPLLTSKFHRFMIEFVGNADYKDILEEDE